MVNTMLISLLQMKAKSRLRNFSNIEDEIDSTFVQPRHPLITYEGICELRVNQTTPAENDEEVKNNDHCKLRPSKCLHGLYDQGNLAKNIRMFD